MSSYWNFHDEKMLELKRLYTKISKQTKNRLQEIFDILKISSNDLYSIADISTKKRINTYIDEWRDKKLLNGYFEMLCNIVYKRKNVKNSEILDLLIYSAYIEEQNKLDNEELRILKDDASYYYQAGQKEVNNKKKVSVIPDAIFLSLISMPDSKGYVWTDYKEATIRYNAEQILRQTVINIQQQKELEINSGEFENIIRKQQNTKLCVNKNNGKISGSVDNFMIGVNNQAKIEGITKEDTDAKVRFVAIEDESTTNMCKSLDGQEFSVKGDNEFTRYSEAHKGSTKYKCKGLMLGLNLPPINDHFHYCRSTLMYMRPVEKEEKLRYNGLASSILNTLENHPKPKLLERIDYKNIQQVRECLEKYEDIIKNSNIENAIVITKNGKVYQCYGNKDSVWPDYDLGNKLKESYVTHNHPKEETEYSFSEADIALFNKYKLKILRGKDYKYTYELNRNENDRDEIDIFNMSIEDGIHALNINRAENYHIGYRRWKND